MALDEVAGGRTDVELRVGDAERHEAATALQKHFAEGRLTWDELDERLKTAYEARTRRDLRTLFADLPEAPKPQPAQTAVERRRGPDRATIVRAGSFFLVMAGIVAVSAGLHFGVIFFPLLILWWRAAGHLPRHANGAPRTRFGNPYAPGGDRHHEVQRLRDQHRARHHHRHD
jgi:hypothetical protein